MLSSSSFFFSATSFRLLPYVVVTIAFLLVGILFCLPQQQQQHEAVSSLSQHQQQRTVRRTTTRPTSGDDFDGTHHGVMNNDPRRPTGSENDDDGDDDVVIVSVQFYGEAMCPFCRRFVTEAWPTVWEDEGIKNHIDYDMVPWGNAYFATTACGVGPYSPTERACWYDNCIIPTTTTSGGSLLVSSPGRRRIMGTTSSLLLLDSKEEEDDCFTGSVVYQHGEREGIIDIYETCIKEDYTLEDAVRFTYCAEGTILDNDDLSPYQILTVCTMSLTGVDSQTVQQCYETRGRELEIANAKVTPSHPGVPYVLVDGVPLDDPLNVKKAICDRFLQRGMKETDLPDGCRG